MVTHVAKTPACGKELLFREALQHLMSHLISAARAAAEDRNLSLRDRLLGAFEAVHCSAFHNASREDALEMLQSAQAAAGALLVQSERDLMGIAAALLTEAGVADRWEQAGVTVAELSEQLLMSAKGIKASVDTLTAYRERNRGRVAVSPPRTASGDRLRGWGERTRTQKCRFFEIS